MLHKIQECLRSDNCSEKKNRPTRSAVTTQPATIEPSVAVLVIACNRDTYIRRTLDSLLKLVHLHSLYAISGCVLCTDTDPALASSPSLSVKTVATPLLLMSSVAMATD